jgi:Transglutaminase-like superfamily
MGRIRRFWYLTRREKFFFLESCILLLVANLSVKIVDFRHINRFLHYWSDRKQKVVPSDDMRSDIELIDLSLSRAANVLPGRNLCLSRSITKLIMLHRRSIPAVLLAGVKCLEDSSLTAHAWVRAGDCVTSGNSEFSENAEFTVLVRVRTADVASLTRSHL